MSDKILPSKKIFSIKDARELSKKRLPKLVFDFIEKQTNGEKDLKFSLKIFMLSFNFEYE